MRRPEADKVILIARFVRQETVGNRGKSSCYATSIVNAAIAIGAVTLQEAQAKHPTIIDNLMSVPDLWNGPVQKIQTLDQRIAEILEKELPIKVGFDSEIGRLMLVPRTFSQIWRDLADKKAAHVIPVPEAVHAYAISDGHLESGVEVLSYVDPLDPYTEHAVTENRFNEVFRPDSQGWISTTQVRQRSI